MLKNNINTGIAPKEHWDGGYENFVFQRNHANDDAYLFIRRYAEITDSRSKSALEIGSFPGTYISELGELGYRINGIDIQPRNATDLAKWLNDQGYQIGDFVEGDVFQYKWRNKFDVVCSFGFIEHFENYLDVIDLHAQLVKEGGTLLITTPNYRGLIQRFMHKYLAPKDYALHYIPSMNPGKWSKHLKERGFEIVFSGYFGGMNFWIGKQELKGFKKIVYEVLMRVLPRIGKFIPFESLLFSKNCGIVARKR